MIPKLHYISQGKTPKEHLENIQKACNSGAELVQLNVHKISDKKLLETAQEARDITSHFQTRLIITDHYKIARQVKADGVFIEDKELSHFTMRKHLYTWQIIGAIAQTLEECKILLDEQVDYITLSPYKSHKVESSAQVALGIDGYTLITEALQTETPIIGAGGICLDDVKEILTAGISGIAVSQAITADFNTIKTFNVLLNASSTKEQRHSFK